MIRFPDIPFIVSGYRRKYGIDDSDGFVLTDFLLALSNLEPSDATLRICREITDPINCDTVLGKLLPQDIFLHAQFIIYKGDNLIGLEMCEVLDRLEDDYASRRDEGTLKVNNTYGRKHRSDDIAKVRRNKRNG